LADYSEHIEDFRAAGAALVAILVDDAARAEPVREELGIKFPLLCDTRREVVKAYGLFNEREAGGIAFPASFVIDRDRVVRFRALEDVARPTARIGARTRPWRRTANQTAQARRLSRTDVHPRNDERTSARRPVAE